MRRMKRDGAENRLESWKEIASYLGRSVRTARRWESEGLPVRRQMHASQGTVYAYAHEIEEWRSSRELSPSLAAERKSQDTIPEHRDDDPSTGSRSVDNDTERPQASLVVLPFAFHGQDSADSYVADGLTDEIIAALSRIQGLSVISRTSSVALRDTAKTASEISNQLGVRYLLEGSVQLHREQLRVTVQLVDAVADRQLSASRYSGELQELFEIQEKIARSVLGELESLLPAQAELPSGSLHLGSKDPNLEAWRCLQRARQLSMRWDREAIDQAVALLHRGIDAVGERLDLCAALGRTHLQYREAALDPTSAPIEQAEHWAKRSAALDPSAPEVRQLDGWIAYSRSDIVGAVAHLRVALRSGANDSETLALLSNCLLISGQVKGARELIDRLLVVDPLTPVHQCMPGFVDAMSGAPQQAVGPYRRMFEMDPGNPLARLFLVWALTAAGRSTEAQETAHGFSPEQQETIPARVAHLFDRAIDDAPLPGLADIEDVLSAYGEMLPRLVAQAYAVAGEVDTSLDWLAVAVDRGFIHHHFMAEHDPTLSALRGTSRFGELLERVRTAWEAFPRQVERRVESITTGWD